MRDLGIMLAERLELHSVKTPFHFKQFQIGAICGGPFYLGAIIIVCIEIQQIVFQDSAR